MAARINPQSPIAITCGDPNGVGPEVIAGALQGLADCSQITLLGPEKWLQPLVSAHHCKGLALGDADFEITPGIATEAGAEIARIALESAAQGCREGRFNAVVTGPVSKEWMSKVGFGWPGQTEFFAAQWGGEPTMAFAGGRLRVVLATWHIPLSAVAQTLNPAVLERAVTRAHELALRCACAVPRIAVCGLNPHAGEGGLLGTEELEWIDPTLNRLREKMPGLSPALPGDTVFRRQVKGEFDVCVALYHDQGLAPLKLLEFDQAVNITMGLPWLRTSPDHGTGYSIASKGIAQCHSMLRAIELAASL